MIKVNTTFTLLQAIAAVVTLATILWFIGVPSFRIAEAANVTTFSNTLSDSEPGMASNHTLSFVTPTGVAAGQTISIDFGTTSFSGIGSLDEVDVDLAVNGVDESLAAAPSGADWGVTAAGTVIDIQSGTSTIGAGATVTIEIGTNATTGGTGSNQISNPTVGSYEITILVGASDTGATRVAIVDVVTVTAAVETIFNFTVTGVGSALNVNGDTTTVVSTPTTVPFGVLSADTQETAAQDLQVSTNAKNGFVVTVQTDQQLTSATGADIDGFANGSYTTSPTLWSGAPPTASLGNENTYGHWGITTDDSTISPGLSDLFDVAGSGQLYVSASTTPVEVFRNDGPIDGTTQGRGITRVGYSVEVSALQEAGDDYIATLTYVATPVF